MDRLNDTVSGQNFQIIWVYEIYMRIGGEDYTFCERWWEFGKVWIDPSLVLGHVGEKEYKGSIGEFMQSPGTAI
jgi:hypothetical protein